jgi:hypothetical protein
MAVLFSPYLDPGVQISVRGCSAIIWCYIVVIGAILSIGLFFLGRYTAENTAGAARTETTTRSGIAEKSIAVFPFANLSHDPDNAYFAAGIQDEIITRLAKIADLKARGAGVSHARNAGCLRVFASKTSAESDARSDL